MLIITTQTITQTLKTITISIKTITKTLKIITNTVNNSKTVKRIIVLKHYNDNYNYDCNDNCNNIYKDFTIKY